MEYIKKVLMLRRTDTANATIKPLSVLARIEIESGVGEFYISAINLPSSIKSANYYAIIVDSTKSVFEFDLGTRPTSFSKTFYEIPNIADGVAIGLYCTSEQIPLTLAFASQGNGILLNEFKKIVADKCLSRFKQSKKEKEEKCACEKVDDDDILEQPPLTKEVLTQYNDEAVATENYYEIDDEIKQKLRRLKEKKNENLFFENEYSTCTDKKTEKEKCFFSYGAQDEKNACECQENKDLDKLEYIEDCANENYFDSVKDELEQIFYTYQKEEGLEKIFSESKWAKIYYSKEKYYVVGLIFENSKEKYICYGVPSRYSKTPPKGLEGYSSFIPLSVFDMFGDGYFIMFQDAKSGRCVHFN